MHCQQAVENSGKDTHSSGVELLGPARLESGGCSEIAGESLTTGLGGTELASGRLGVVSTRGEASGCSLWDAAYSTRLTVSVPSAKLDVDRRLLPGGERTGDPDWPGKGRGSGMVLESRTWLLGREGRSPFADLAERNEVAMLCRLLPEWVECAEFWDISDKGREGGLEMAAAAGITGGSNDMVSCMRGEGEYEVSSTDMAGSLGWDEVSSV